MSATPSARRPDPGIDADADTDDLPGDEAPGVDDDADDLNDTGIDLTEASDLDADNVLADEESSRVQQAPD